MKKKTIIKLISITLLIIIFLIPTQTLSEAVQIDTNIVQQPNSGMQSEFDDIGKVIFGAIQGIGIGISVIVIIVLGIKYLLGSVEEKAQYKNSMIPYILGVIFLAGATTIPNIIYTNINTLHLGG